MISRPQTKLQPAPPPDRRSGVVVFELLIWLPVLAILLLAIIEFGQIFVLDQQVAQASRFGALIASQTVRYDSSAAPDLTDLVTSSALTTRIENYLRTAGVLNGPCQVTLYHNACLPGTSQTHTTAATGCASCPAAPPNLLPTGNENPPSGGNPRESYVQVTVCVPLQNNVPNLLSSFGFNINDRTLMHTTLLRYEVNNQAPNPVIRLNAPLPTGVTPEPGFGVVPAVCPVDCSPHFIADISDGAPASITLNFDANLSTDPDNNLNPPTTFTWTSTGSPSAGSGATYSASFPRPAAGSVATFQVYLTTLDSCGRQSLRAMNVIIHSQN